MVAAYDYHERVFNPPMPILFQHRVGAENRAISAPAIRKLLDDALATAGLTGTDGQPLRFVPHDFRRIFITDAVMNGMPPHIAQLVVGHRDLNTTMGYKAVYPEEAINGHRAFIARRRELRPSAEYRTPTDEEWEEFLGHFERRKLALGDCGRAYGTTCIHEHSCVRCPLLRVDPAQRPRLAGIADNLITRIAEAHEQGWTGEAEGLKVSLAAAQHKLAELDRLAARRTTIDLGSQAFPDMPAAATTDGPAVTDTADLAAALRAHARGLHTREAAIELLIGNASWLHRATSFIPSCTPQPASSTAPRWRRSTGPPRSPPSNNAHLPCSGGEGRILRLAASLANAIPVDLQDALTGLDNHNTALTLAARQTRNRAPMKLPRIHETINGTTSSENASTDITGLSARPRRRGSGSPRWTTRSPPWTTRPRCRDLRPARPACRSRRCWTSGWRSCRTRSPRRTPTPATGINCRFCRPSSP